MQRARIAVGAEIDASPSLARAREAWHRADFVVCLAELDAADMPGPGSPLRDEAVLLRARALYRLKRYREVVAGLGPVLARFADVDAACTARMLHAAALARSGDDQGLVLLAEVAAAADARQAHHAVRAEIAHARALAHWVRRELDETLRFALAAETAQADVISVRAMQLRGFVAVTRRDYRQALAIFRAVLEAYRACRERDADLAEMTVFQIASLELTLRSKDVTGTHASPDGRRTRPLGEPEPEHASVTRMQTLVFDAWLYAHDGDAASAFRQVRRAEDAVPSPDWRVWALANRAAVAYAFGDVASAREHAAHALEIAERVDWNVTAGEERVGLLMLAQVLASTDPLAAVTILRQYDTLTSTIPADEVFSDDPRLDVLEYSVRGLVKRICGDAAAAREELTKAYRTSVRHGFVARAAVALIELDATPTGARGDFSLESAAALVREHFPRSFLARRLGSWAKVYGDPVAARLTRTQREILRHLLAGRVPKEIAAATGRAYKTVRNHVEAIEEVFGVHSVPELIVTCYQRGLEPPPQPEPRAHLTA